MTDYDGQITHIPVGNSGIISDLAPSQAPYNSLARAYNVDFAPGYIQKAPGAIQYNRYALSAGIVALLDYWPTTYQQRLFAATSDGKIFRDSGDRFFGANWSSTTPTAIKSGLGSLTTRSQFVVGGNEVSGNPKKVFFFSGGISQVQVLSGDNSTFGAISMPSTDWPNPTASSNPQSNFPRFGLIHRGLLWCFAKSQSYASTATNHEDFQSASTQIHNVGPGEGGDICGAYVYKEKLIVWKEGDFLYILNDSDSSTANWYFTRFGKGLGIASWHAACQVIDDLLVGNVTGKVTSLTATLNFGDFSQGDIFKKAKVSRFFAENLSTNGILPQQSLYYSEKGIALFTGRTRAQQTNNCLIQLDVSQPENPRYGLWNHVAADCLTLRRDTTNIEKPTYGAADGFVYLMDREDRTVGSIGNNSAFTGEFWTQDLDLRHLDPSLAHKNKLWEFLGVTFQEENAGNLSVDVWLDGRFRETLTFSQTVDSNYCGAFVLGTSRTGGLDEKTIWQPMHGTGRRLTLRCYNSGANQNFKVSMLSLGWKPSGEQATVL